MNFRATRAILLSALLLTSPLVAFGAPPASPYQPGETIAPTCAPTSTNCTVRGYAAAGANSDITSLSGLTTALPVTEGGTGHASFTPGDILYASGPTTIAGLGLGTAGSVLSLVNGLPVWQATTSLGLLTDSLLEGVNKFYSDSLVFSYLNTLSKDYFFSTSSINLWKTQTDFFSAASSTAWLLTRTTDDLTEGVRKYYTDARVDSRISATTTIATLLSLPNLSNIGTVTSGIWHGSPIDAGSYISNLDIPLAALLHATTTDALTQGLVNKYYSDAQVTTLLDTIGKSYFFSTSSANTWKTTQDFFSSASSTAWLLTKTTDDLTEGTRKYFTDARADARISATSTIATLLSLPNLSGIGTVTSGIWHGSPIDAVSYVTNLSVPFGALLHATTTDALSEGTLHKYYSDSAVSALLDTVSKSYFFSTSSADTWKNTRDFFSAASSTSWLLTKTTDDLTEGTRKYFTDARADARISATSTLTTLTSTPNLTTIGTIVSGVWNGSQIDASQYLFNLSIPLGNFLHSTTTDALAEGTVHKYYSDVAVSSLLDTMNKSYFFSTSSADTWKSTKDFFSAASSTAWLLTKSTDDLTEGTRKYFTDARADARISATSTIATLLSLPNLSGIGTVTSGTWNGSPIDAVSYVSNLAIPFGSLLHGTTTDALSEGSLHKYYSDLAVSTFLDTVGKSYFFSTSSANNWKTTQDFFSAASSTTWLLSKTTDDLTEGTRKYFTDARADARISATSTIATLLSLPNLSGIGTVTSGVWHGSPIDATTYISNLSGVFGSFLHGTTTDALIQGTVNKYYSDSLASTFLDTVSKSYFFSTTSADVWKSSRDFFSSASSTAWLLSKTTDDLTEGTRKYYTDARVGSYIISSSSIPHIPGGGTGEILSWNGSGWGSRATSTLAIALADTKGLLANSQLQNSSITLTAGSGLTGGSAVSLGSSGSLSLDLANPNSWTGLQQFANASSSALSVSGTAYFGSGATTLFSSAGDLTLGTAGTNAVLTLNASGKLVASSTPSVSSLIATSTTATSTFAGGFAVGTNKLLVDRTSGDVSIANSLSVAGKVTSLLGFNGACFSGSQTVPLNLGTLLGVITSLGCNKDLAESYPTYEPTEAGDVVAIPPEGDAYAVAQVGKARGIAGEAVLGVVSTNPGLVFHNNGTYLAGDNNNLATATTTVIALAGRVPVKISLENGPIAPGDDLVPSHTLPGYAARSKGPGMVLGTALGSFPNETAGMETPIVMLFVNLHWSPGHFRQSDETASSTALISDFGRALQSALSEFGITLLNGFLQLQEVVTDRLTTKELCLQDVCITKEDLQQLLERNSMESSFVPPFASSTDSEETPSPEESTSSPETDPPPAEEEETPVPPTE